jgi:hypothetical protein
LWWCILLFKYCRKTALNDKIMSILWHVAFNLSLKVTSHLFNHMQLCDLVWKMYLIFMYLKITLTLKSNDKYLMPSCRNIFPLNTWISDHSYFISSSLYQFYNILKLKTVLNFDIAEILLKLALNTNQSIDQVSLNMVFTCLNQTQ